MEDLVLSLETAAMERWRTGDPMGIHRDKRPTGDVF